MALGQEPSPASIAAALGPQILGQNGLDPGSDLFGPSGPPDPYNINDETARNAARDRLQSRLDRYRVTGRDQKMRANWRNILFYRGYQWIVWSRASNGWRPAPLKPGSSRPVTNRFASTMDAYCSILARIEPVMTYRPATEDPADIATADMADRVMEVIQEEVGARLARQWLSHWAGFCGGAWIEVGYDPSDEYGTRLVQHEMCPACGTQQPPTEDGVCANCGAQTVPAQDEQGTAIGHPTPVGRMYWDVCSEFEIYQDSAVEDTRKLRDIIRRKSLPVEEAKRRWPKYADQIVPDMAQNTGEQYLNQLSSLGPFMDEVGVPASQIVPFNRGGHDANRVSETYYHCLPDDEYPDGALIIMIGTSLIVYMGPRPYWEPRADGGKEYFLNFVHFPTKLVGGSNFPKTVADDLALKQVQRNKIESFIMDCLWRVSAPVWMVPAGANISNMTGTPGQVYIYNPLTLGNARPERIPGQALPVGVFQQLQQIDKDFEEIAATYDVVKGNKPAGVSAGVAMQMLQERSNSRQGGLYILWEQAHARLSKMSLNVFRQYATEPRLRAVMGKNGAWQIQKFMGADLEGAIDVVAEAGSGAPKSTLVERATIEQAFNIGVLSNRDPEVQQKVLDMMGLSYMHPGLKEDTKAAAIQLEQFESLAQNPQVPQMLQQLKQQMLQEQQMQAQQAAMQQGQPPPQGPPPPPDYNAVADRLAQMGIQVPKIHKYDNHAVFAGEFSTWLKSEYAQSLPLPIQELVELAHDQHQQIYQQGQSPTPPEVKVNLRGDLYPDQSAQLAGVQPEQSPPPQKGSSMLEVPAQAPRRPTPTAAGASAARLTGDIREMGRAPQG